MKPYKFLLAGLLAMSLAGAAHAADFFDSALTVQGKTLDLGAAGRTQDYAAFTTNGTFSASTGLMNEIDVFGNVGVFGSSLTLSNSVINGNATLKKDGKFNVPNSSQITGSRFQSQSYDTILQQGVSDAKTFTSQVKSLNGTSNFTATGFTMGSTMNLVNQNVTLSATDNNPVVLKLSSGSLTNSTLTLNGSSTSHFIFDIAGGAFAAGNSNVLLTGGLTVGNVAFVLEGGSASSITGNSTVNGLIVAVDRDFTMSGGSLLNGELIGKSITLSGGSKIKKPRKPST